MDAGGERKSAQVQDVGADVLQFEELELIAKLEGKISDQVVNITNYNQTYIDLKAIVIRATKDYPDIQRRIIEELGDA